ncbi:MAG: ABC transporter permease [Bacteroidetes bacterium]|uniref:ABC transporter permease n=1 Tax=Candidatus Pullibacteroides excrementavium TaxID=2840905 RepID=A0A9D9DTA8_9BACT|nr:ABC transporter permease [Candidatus Pullibacteroides excrementavium]
MISTIGRYFLLMAKVFSPPGKRKLFWKQVVEEIHQLGFDSIPIVSLVSIFVGAAITIQLQINMDSPWIPIYAVGFATRKAIVMELAPTIIGLILAGKIGSHIASQLGTMRVTEQIDAIEVMGLNSASYLILPKIIACLIFNPILIMLSIVAALFGGWAVGISIGGMSSYEFIYGLQSFPHNFDLVYAIIKTIVFAFFISSISSFYGYSVQGGAIEVGKASTKAVVNSSIAIILSNLVLTQLLM